MTIPTVTEVNEFKVDLDDAEALVNGSESVTTRLGGVKESYSQLVGRIAHGDITTYSAASTYSAITDWVEESGVVYRPLPSALPIGPESFDSANWVVVQDGGGWQVTTAADYATLRSLDPGNYAVGDPAIILDEDAAGLFTVASGTATDNEYSLITNATWNSASKHWKRAITTGAVSPPGSGFAPNERKFLFMDPAEYSAGNSGADALEEGNQFHYFGTGSDIRVEFEADVGDMQFYIESGVGQSAWYGWQEGATHHYSMGTDPTSNYDMKFCSGFGVEGKFAHFLIRGPGSAEEGQVRVRQDTAGIAPFVISTTDTTGALGLLCQVGQSTSTYLADFRLADDTVQVRVTGTGHVQTRNGTAAAPAYGYVGDTNTGAFNPGADAWSIATAGVERTRVNSLGQLLVSDGSASQPGMGFLNDSDTGQHLISAGVVGFDSGGAVVGKHDASYWYLKTPDAAPTDANMANGFIVPYLNESGNELKVRVRYSDGTFKTATIALT